MTKEIKAGMALGAALFEYKDSRNLSFYFGDMDIECWSEDNCRKYLAEKLSAARKAVRAWIPKHKRSCENCGCLCRDEEDPSQWYCARYNIDESGRNPDESSCAEWKPNTQKGGEQ